MSLRDETLRRWPRLATFPSTNGFLVLVMLLWLSTGLAALVFALLTGLRPTATKGVLAVPDAWYDALKVLTGIVVVQFIGKRGTDVTLWRKPQLNEPPATGAP